MAGGNGSGKTTLIKLLTGLYLPDSGSIYVDEQIVGIATYHQYRELFAAVLTDFHLFSHLYGVQGLEQERATQMLKRLQLEEKTRFTEHGEITNVKLSSGQRKRLAYAVAWLEDRSIYVFDEFAAEQDPHFRDYFYHELMPDLRRAGKTVIAVTHDDRYYHLADRVVKLEDGKITG